MAFQTYQKFKMYPKISHENEILGQRGIRLTHQIPHKICFSNILEAESSSGYSCSVPFR